jgi:hypothetical protein
LEEDPYFETPLDEINPYIHFAHVISSLSSTHPVRQFVTPSHETKIQAIISTAAEQLRSLSAAAKQN